MRCDYALVPALLACAVTASAQTQIQVIPPQPRLTFVAGLANGGSSASIDDVVARVMSFDSNLDRKVAISELPERMEGLVAVGDTDGDAALARGEIEKLASAPSRQPVRVLGSSVYGFADDVGFSGFSSSRSHIEGAIDDLRLTAARQARATAAATAFVDALEAQRRATLLQELEQVLTAANLQHFTQALDSLDKRRRSAADFVKGSSSGVRRVLVPGPNLQTVIGQYGLAPEPRTRAFDAVQRFEERTRLNEAEQAALVDQLQDVLEGHERDDLRAALARRPVVQMGGAIRPGAVRLDNPALFEAVVVEH